MKNNNKIRTFWGWETSKNKNIVPHQNFTGSYKKSVLIKAILKLKLDKSWTVRIKNSNKKNLRLTLPMLFIHHSTSSSLIIAFDSNVLDTF